MGRKTKIVLLSIQRVYKDNTKSPIVQVTSLGIYRSFSEKLMDSIRDTILFLFKDEPEVANSFGSDNWLKLYKGVMKYFDSDSGYGTYSISNNNIGELSSININISVLNPNNHGQDNLLFWINPPKHRTSSPNTNSKYGLLKEKINNTHYTN